MVLGTSGKLCKGGGNKQGSKGSTDESGQGPWCQFGPNVHYSSSILNLSKVGFIRGVLTQIQRCQAARDYTKTKSILFHFRAGDYAAVKQ